MMGSGFTASKKRKRIKIRWSCEA